MFFMILCEKWHSHLEKTINPESKCEESTQGPRRCDNTLGYLGDKHLNTLNIFIAKSLRNIKNKGLKWRKYLPWEIKWTIRNHKTGLVKTTLDINVFNSRIIK